MQHIIKSRKHGDQVFTARANPDGFVYVRLGDRQICEGGTRSGVTVMCRGTEEGLRQAARRWWAAHMRRMRSMK